MKKITLLLLLVSSWAIAQNSSLNDKIEAIVKNKNATVGISVMGFEDKFNYNKNGDKKLPMLSVFKFHIALVAMDLVDKGKLSLDQKIVIKKEELLPNTYSPIRKKFPNGTEITLSELIKYTVAESDNNTTDILIRLIGGTNKIQDFFNSKRVKDFQIKHNEEQMHKGVKYLYENFTTPNSLATLYKSFFKNKIVSKKSTEFLYEIMLETSTGTNKLKEQLPQNTIAHRTGSSGKDGNLTIAENDSGIVTLPNGKHYSIVVFVNDSTESEKDNCKMISDISKIFWDYFISKK